MRFNQRYPSAHSNNEVVEEDDGVFRASFMHPSEHGNLFEPAEVGRGRRNVSVYEERAAYDELQEKKTPNGSTASGVESICMYIPIILLVLCLITLLIMAIFAVNPFDWIGTSTIWHALPKPPGFGGFF